MERVARYTELRPEELALLWSKNPFAVVPWGALEWHGPHLPLGLDGIVAEAFAERLALAAGGVLLPTTYMPITTLPHPTSLQIRTSAFRAILDDTLGGLYEAGARRVAVVTGHYAHGHEIELYEAAMYAIDDGEDFLVYAATPLEPMLRPELLDHAGRIETSQLLSIRPDLVHLECLPEELHAYEVSVIGQDPRHGSADEGEALLEEGLASWMKWLQYDRIKLHRWYGQAFDRYQPYVDTYYQTSWEQAILDWWETK